MPPRQTSKKLQRNREWILFPITHPASSNCSWGHRVPGQWQSSSTQSRGCQATLPRGWDTPTPPGNLAMPLSLSSGAELRASHQAAASLIEPTLKRA